MFRGTDDIVLEGAVTKACAHDVVAAATRIDDFILFNNIAIYIYVSTSNKDGRGGVVKHVIL